MKYSPLMQNFINDAAKQGLMPDVSVKLAYKKIQEAKKTEPTDNLDVNLAKLASALRDKGMLEDAQALEKKFLLFKEASIHFDAINSQDIEPFLDFAHQDGDVQVADSVYGKFHTLQSIQQAFIDNLNNTNKKQVKALAYAAADALGLIKEAQDEDPLGQGTVFGPEPTETENPNLSKEEIEQFTLDPEQKEKIDHINDVISKYKSTFNKVVDQTDKLFDSLADSIWRAPNALENSPAKLKFYCEANGISESDVTSYFNIYHFWLGSDTTMDASLVAKKLQSLSYAQVQANLGMIPTQMYEYVQGAQSIFQNIGLSSQTKYQMTAQGITPNDKSIYIFDGDKVSLYKPDIIYTIIAPAVINWIKDLGDKLFSVTFTTNVVQATVAKVAPIRALMQNLKAKDIRTVNFSTGKSLNDTISIVNQIDAGLKSLGENELKDVMPEYLTALSMDINNAKAAIVVLVPFLQENSIHPNLDKIIPNDQLKGIKSVLSHSIKSWYDYRNALAQANKNDPKIKVIDSTIQHIGSLARALSGDVHTFSQIHDNLSKVPDLGKINSIDDLNNFIQNTIVANTNQYVPEQYNKLQTKTSYKPSLNKKAQWGNLSGAPAKGPSAPSGGNAPSAPLPAEKTPQSEAVAKMQLLLIRLASDVLLLPENKDKSSNDANIIMRVGPHNAKSLTDVDGRWGPNTYSALKVANKYVGGSLELGDAISGMMKKTPDEIKTSANKNVQILANYLSQHNVSVPGITDQNAKTFTLDSILIEVDGTVDNGMVSLTSDNLSSLDKFYNFVKSNFTALIQKNVSGDIGMSVKQWFTIMGHLVNRADAKLKEVAGSRSAQLAEYYRNLVFNLREQVINLLKRSGFHDFSPEGIQSDWILDENSFASNSVNNGLPGKNLTSPQSKNSPFGFTPSKSLEGQTIDDLSGQEGDASAPPFGNVINLSSYYWKNSKAASFTQMPISISFLRNQVIDQATQLFPDGGDISEEALQSKYLNERGANLASSYNEDHDTYYVRDSQGRVSDLKNLKDFINWSSKYRSSGALIKYRNLLRSLLVGLRDSLQQWIQNTSPAEAAIVQMQKNQSIWVAAINHAIDEINDFIKG